MSEANKAAMRRFFEEVYNQGNDKAVEHWHEWSGLGLMQQLGVLPA